jgi:hypothetical protein
MEEMTDHVTLMDGTLKSPYKIFDLKKSPLELIPLSHSYFSKMNVNVIIPCRSPNRSIPCRFSLSLFLFCASNPAHQIRLYLMTLTILVSEL